MQPPAAFLGRKHGYAVMTQNLIDDKLRVALAALNEIDPKQEMEYAVESRVGFGDFLPDVFGSTDLLGRIGDRAIVLDWKFGDGVPVAAEENPQLMFYAAAAMRTPATQWVFEGVSEVELIIVQPPSIKRWTTTVERIQAFEQDLAAAVTDGAEARRAAGRWRSLSLVRCQATLPADDRRDGPAGQGQAGRIACGSDRALSGPDTDGRRFHQRLCRHWRTGC
jgi:hypothetical protein